MDNVQKHDLIQCSPCRRRVNTLAETLVTVYQTTRRHIPEYMFIATARQVIIATPCVSGIVRRLKRVASPPLRAAIISCLLCKCTMKRSRYTGGRQKKSLPSIRCVPIPAETMGLSAGLPQDGLPEEVQRDVPNGAERASPSPRHSTRVVPPRVF
jgi:hypothetical protein